MTLLILKIAESDVRKPTLIGSSDSQRRPITSIPYALVQRPGMGNLLSNTYITSATSLRAQARQLLGPESSVRKSQLDTLSPTISASRRPVGEGSPEQGTSQVRIACTPLYLCTSVPLLS